MPDAATSLPTRIRAAAFRKAMCRLRELGEANAGQPPSETLAANLVLLRDLGVDDEILDLAVEMMVAENADERLAGSINYLAAGFLLALLALEDEHPQGGAARPTLHETITRASAEVASWPDPYQPHSLPAMHDPDARESVQAVTGSTDRDQEIARLRTHVEAVEAALDKAKDLVGDLGHHLDDLADALAGIERLARAEGAECPGDLERALDRIIDLAATVLEHPDPGEPPVQIADARRARLHAVPDSDDSDPQDGGDAA